jgi:hypothetical protein
MNSGLPSLLDAIFGKKELSTVSLDELYELINEFPSFNAAHYLLSKKLKQEDHSDFEMETRRTALYFNNPFWLQTILGSENNHPTDGNTSGLIEKTFSREEVPALETAITDKVQNGEELTPEEDHAVEIISRISETFEVEITLDEPVQTVEIYQESEITTGPVTSFDELLSKYKSETEEQVETRDQIQNPLPIPDILENREEIVNNEYGIFEEEPPKKVDHDLDDFDRPSEETNTYPERVIAEIPETEREPETTESDSILENQRADSSVDKSDEEDFEAFDRPLVKTEPEANRSASESEMRSETLATEADNTDSSEVNLEESSQESDDLLKSVSDRFREDLKPVAAFDPTKADSIVFAPYHMVDYFASQGIKLVLEDQPADQFGKQLKSFTDWLKVMKRIPAKPLNENTDEKEVDRIRHFAAHSIEERDILTESMAEVLAKQGMIENAIALYHKLSLIYPPKSAYFASRIEQLKASLP